MRSILLWQDDVPMRVYFCATGDSTPAGGKVPHPTLITDVGLGTVDERTEVIGDVRSFIFELDTDDELACQICDWLTSFAVVTKTGHVLYRDPVGDELCSGFAWRTKLKGIANAWWIEDPTNPDNNILYDKAVISTNVEKNDILRVMDSWR